MSTFTGSESVSGPRGKDIEGVLITLGSTFGVKVTIDHVSKGLFRKRVYFTVSGEMNAVGQWCDAAISTFTR